MFRQRVGKENLRFAQSVADCIGDCFGERGAHAIPETCPVLRQRRGKEGPNRLFQVVQGSAIVQGVRKRLADFVAKAQGAQAANTGAHKGTDASSYNRHHRAHGRACCCACADHADLGSALGILVLRVLAGGLGAAVQVSHACADAQKAQKAAQNPRAARCGRSCRRGRVAAQRRANGAQGAANAAGNGSEGAVRVHSRLCGALLQELAQPAVRGGQALCGQGRRVDFNGRSLKGCLPVVEKPCCTRQGSGCCRCARAGDQRSAGAAGKRGFCCLADFGARPGAEVSRLQNHHLGRYVHNGRGSFEGAAHGRKPGSAGAGVRATAQAQRSGQAAELRIGACRARHQLKAQNCANGCNLALVALCPGFQAVENHVEVQAVHKARNEVCANGCAVVNGSGGVNAQQRQESGSNAAAKASAQACGPVGEELAAAAVPPLVERLRHDLVPGNAQLAPNVGVCPLVARGKLRNGLAQVFDLGVHMVHCVADCIFHQRHFAGDPGCKFPEVRGKALAQGNFCAVNRRLQ